MRRYIVCVILALVAGAAVSLASIRLRAARVQVPEPRSIKTKTVTRPGEPLPDRPRGVSAVTFAPNLEAEGELLPGRRVRVRARADLEMKPRGVGVLYAWKLAFIRDPDKPNWKEDWSWYYDRPIPVRPGEHIKPTFEETVTMPPGWYLVQTSLAESHWEETEDGPVLVPDEAGASPMQSFTIEVP